MPILLCINTNWIKPEVVVAICALGVSLASLYVSYKSSKQTTHLSIQQELLKLVLSRTNNCNTVWRNEEMDFYSISDGLISKAITEIIVSLEILENSFLLFEKNYEGIKETNESILDKVFWKNLNTNLRKYIMNYKFEGAEKETYKNQLRTIHNRFERYFEIATPSN